MNLTQNQKDDIIVIVIYVLLHIPVYLFASYQSASDILYTLGLYEVFLITGFFLIYTVKTNLEKKIRR